MLIVSPSPSRRDALRSALESDEVRVMGEGEDRDLRPSVTVVDGADALETLADVEEGWPSALVLLLDHHEPAALEELRRFDAPGWAVLPADAPATQLRAGVLAAAAGLAVVVADWQATAGTGILDGRQAAEAADGGAGDDDEMPGEALTAREAEVLAWLARGLSNRQIGARLGISEHTAKFHVAAVLAKLRAHNRADAVRRGVRRGVVAV